MLYLIPDVSTSVTGISSPTWQTQNIQLLNTTLKNSSRVVVQSFLTFPTRLRKYAWFTTLQRTNGFLPRDGRIVVRHDVMLLYEKCGKRQDINATCFLLQCQLVPQQRLRWQILAMKHVVIPVLRNHLWSRSGKSRGNRTLKSFGGISLRWSKMCLLKGSGGSLALLLDFSITTTLCKG